MGELKERQYGKIIMAAISGYGRILGHVLHAYAQHYFGLNKAHPITLTFSVTSRCQSLCLTCGIGEKSRSGYFKKNPDLRLDEIEKIFRSLGPVYFFNISGGEPFLRRDLTEIVGLAVKYLNPAIIHIPTNALVPEPIERQCRDILRNNRKIGLKIPLTVKPSIDGVGRQHDFIRGVPGNFQKLEETIVRLKMLEEDYPEFHLELGTVVSRYNIDHLHEIEDYVHSVGIQSYRHEIAEERTEFFNKGSGIAPSVDVYANELDRFSQEIKNNLADKRQLTRLTESLRLTYYDLAVEILRRQTQVIPCYGGVSNLHLNYDGELWPCCVLGYDHPLAKLREVNYDVKAALASRQAKEVLTFIRKKGCYCPLANQWYSNVLLNPRLLTRVIFKYILVDRRAKKV